MEKRQNNNKNFENYNNSNLVKINVSDEYKTTIF